MTDDTFAQIDEQCTHAEFIVIDGDARSILGRKTALELGVLRVGHGQLEVNSLTVDQMTSRFPELFKGIGKLKNYQARLHIDPEVRPVVLGYETKLKLKFRICFNRISLKQFMDLLHG